MAEKNYDWVIDVLKETVEKFHREIWDKLRKRLRGRDLTLLDFIWKHYYSQKNFSRWYDIYHIPSSTLFGIAIAESRVVSPLIIPGIMMHDIGYCVIGGESDPRKRDNRLTHMQEGAALASRILSGCRLYAPEEIGQIVGMVATHDNGYLGIQEVNPDRLAVRDADRFLVMSFLSFWKDWANWQARLPDFTPYDLLKVRRASFFNEPVDDIPPETKTELNYQPMYTGVARKILKRQFAARQKECDGGVIMVSPDIFREYTESQLWNEIEVNRV